MNIPLTKWQRLSTLLIIGLLVVGVGTQIKPPKIFRIGVLNPDAPIEDVFHGFKAEMVELGYTEGQTIEFLYEGPSTNEPGKLEAAAAALMDAHVDMILAITTGAATVAKEAVAGTDVPVVFWVMADPVAEGYVETMQRPGGNLTGLTIGVEGIASEGRRLDWLMQIAPDVERVFIPYDPNHRPVVEQAIPTIQEAADALGVELVLHEIHSPEEARASAQALPNDIDAIYIIHLDRMVMSARGDFAASALEHHLPLSVFDNRRISDGALMAFGTQYTSIGEQAAHLADQILKGAQAAELPVEIPEFYLTINLQAAEAIGLEISESIIRQADFVIR
jgi:putative ABC transport system substrate-binding protein